MLFSLLNEVLRCRHLKRNSLFGINYARLGTSSVRSNNRIYADDEFEYISPITAENYEQVWLHFRCNFLIDEVMSKTCGVVDREDLLQELESFCVKGLKDNVSIMALHCSSNKIAATCLNTIIHSGDPEKKLASIKTYTDPKFKACTKLMSEFNSCYNIFEIEEVDKIFEVTWLSVDRNFRGKKLGIKLVELSEDIAREQCFKIMKADETGVYSQKIFGKQGYEVIFEKKYEDIKNEDGEIILRTEPPNLIYQVGIKRLED